MSEAATCAWRDALGRPGVGVHRARLPGTDTALWDFVGTIAAAWGLSAATGIRASLTTIALLVAAEALHWAFCVRTGNPSK
eukprot:scaffold85168_cov19-Prasinocladus_malaysianus.AAC.2